MDSIVLSKKLDYTLYDLQTPVVGVDDDFTLYDLFSIVKELEQNTPGVAVAFGMPNFEAFWDRIQKDPDESKDIKYLELYWSMDYDARDRKMTPEEKAEYVKTNSPNDILYSEKKYWDDLERGEMSNLMAFHGRGKYSQKEIESWLSLPKDNSHLADDACGYAIEFSSVNNLKDYPIRISDHVAMPKPFTKYMHPTEEIKTHRTGFTLKISPTLYCVITSVFWELTFCGFTPQEVDDKREDIVGRTKDIMDQMDDENVD